MSMCSRRGLNWLGRSRRLLFLLQALQHRLNVKPQGLGHGSNGGFAVWVQGERAGHGFADVLAGGDGGHVVA